MMGSRPHSSSASSADQWEQQAEGPGPAKRRRTEEPTDHEFEVAPRVDNVMGTPDMGALTSLVILADGYALHLPLDDVDLVLEPEPTSVLQVSLGDNTLILVPGALLEFLEGESHSALGLEQGSFLNAPGECVALEQGFYGPVPEIAGQEEVYQEDADTVFPPAGMNAAASSVAGLLLSPRRASDPDFVGLAPEPWPQAPNPTPERGSPHHQDNLDLHVPEFFPDSPLQPLPPSPCPGSHERPQHPPVPARKAQRRLFQE
ncbi:proline-rich protein 23C [Bos taurus]|nr:proline-rich protein 23C [Bos taurus]